MTWKVVTPDYNLYPTPINWLDAESSWGPVRALLTVYDGVNRQGVWCPLVVDIWRNEKGGDYQHNYGHDIPLSSICWTGWQVLVEDTDGISGMEELPNVVDEQMDRKEPGDVLLNHG